MSSQTRSKDIKKQSGRWTKQEHQRFMLGIVQYGKDWKKVQQIVGTRSGSQVRSHAQKYFNRLQKDQNLKNKKEILKEEEVSETQNDFIRSLPNEDISLNTPMEIISLIRKQSKQDKTVHVNTLVQKLQNLGGQPLKQQSKEIKQKQSNSLKGMTNILNAFQNLKDQNLYNQFEDQSFLILLTKKYKKYFGSSGNFQNLIDLKNPKQIKQAQESIRKRSFTLPDGQQCDEEKLIQIKKKIFTKSNNQHKIVFQDQCYQKNNYQQNQFRTNKNIQK